MNNTAKEYISIVMLGCLLQIPEDTIIHDRKNGIIRIVRVKKGITHFGAKTWLRNCAVSEIVVRNWSTGIKEKINFEDITYMALPQGIDIANLVEAQRVFNTNHDKFEKLRKELDALTYQVNAVEEKLAHPICREIVSMGWSVVPHILASMVYARLYDW